MARWLMNSLALLWLLASSTTARGEDSFHAVAAILERKCVNCHNAGEHQGGLNLETAAAAKSGGDSGPVFDAGSPDASLIVDYVSGDKPQMPKRGAPLTAEEVAALRSWIKAGAVWPAERKLVDKYLASSDWWSLQPIKRPVLPKLSAEDSSRLRTPVDAFILAKLREQKLSPAPEADRRTLIRRLYFDLIGLPPAPEAISAFERDDHPQAYERLVNQLLESPRYGERWARHWLDVVHYGDTHGYDKDKVRPHAWPYRDYIIRALNEDKPYSRFVEEQLAGDVLYPGTRDGIEALGFLSAGPWDFVGHAEVGEDKLDGQIARMLDRDDMVSTTMNAFVSTTAQCARCHNHKFDPITTDHYYGLQAVFAAIDRADRPYDADPAVAARRATLQQRLNEQDQAVARAQQKIQDAVGTHLVEVDSRIDALQTRQKAPQRPEYGYHSGLESQAQVTKWVQLELADVAPLSQIVLAGCHDNFNNIGAGFGFPVRFKIEAASDADFKSDVVLVADHTAADYPNPGVLPQSFDARGVKAKHLRITVTKLALRQNDFHFALAEVVALGSDGNNVARDAKVTALDSIEAPIRWSKKNLTDGVFIGGWNDEDLAALAKLQAERTALFEKSVTPAMQAAVAEAQSAALATRQAIANLPPQQQLYCGTIHTGSGAFRGTGPLGKPRDVFVLSRGDVRSRVKPAVPSAPEFIPGRAAAFDLPAEHAESARRAALAKWIVDRDNPLTWRSIANRVWQYHFGRGIVDSANDFGRMGSLPTHPELLDYLAVEFRDGRQSLKDLHRLIVLSSTYRQSSLARDDAAAIDAENRYYWRQERRRLEAEALHDATLLMAGKLDLKMYGPGYRPFGFRDDHSPEYKYHEHDPDDPASHRRSIYRFIVRSVPDPFLETLDCADPSAVVGKRNETLTPLQALALMNNKFMVRMSEHFAARVESQGSTPSEQVAAAFRLATGRDPSDAERSALVTVADKHGLASACRVILNASEFVFVD